MEKHATSPLQNPGPGRREPKGLGNALSSFMLHTQGNLTWFIISELCFARTMGIESGRLVNLMVSGCCRYFLSLRMRLALLFFSSSREPLGDQPMPLSQLRSDLYTFWKDSQGHKAAQHPPYSAQPLLLPREALTNKTHSPAPTQQTPQKGLPLSSPPHYSAPYACNSSITCQASHKALPTTFVVSLGKTGPFWQSPAGRVTGGALSLITQRSSDHSPLHTWQPLPTVGPPDGNI